MAKSCAKFWYFRRSHTVWRGPRRITRITRVINLLKMLKTYSIENSAAKVFKKNHSKAPHIAKMC